MLDPIINFGKATVSTGYNAGVTTIVLASGHGARFPNPSTEGAFNVVWWNNETYRDPTDDPNREIVRVTARTGDTLTIVRGQESTTASTKNTGNEYLIVLAVTKKTITDIGDAINSKISSAEKGAANGVATLGADSKIPSSQLPALAITDTFIVASQSAMLALSAEKGDVAIRSDINKSFILSDTDPTTLANWKELLTPTDTVLSVNGLTGTVVLTTSNISEGSNLYFTNSRAVSALSGTLSSYWKNDGSATATGNWNIGSNSFTAGALYGTSLGLNNGSDYGFIGLESDDYVFGSALTGSPSNLRIGKLKMEDPTSYGYNGFGEISLDSDLYYFRNSSENSAGIGGGRLKLSDDYAGGLGNIELYDGTYTFLNASGVGAYVNASSFGFDGGYVGQYSSFASGQAGINADGTSFFENGNFAFNQYNPQLTTDGIAGIFINNTAGSGIDIKGAQWSLFHDGSFSLNDNSFYWNAGGYLYVLNNITTKAFTAWDSTGLVFKNSGGSAALTLGASSSVNATFTGIIGVDNANPQIILTSAAANSATSGTVKFRTPGGSEYVDLKFDASANLFSMTYGTTTLMSFNTAGSFFNSPSSGTGGITTTSLTANTWTNASLVNKLINGTVTLNQSGTAGFDFIDISFTQTAVGSGEKNLIRFLKNGTGVFTVDYLGRVAINKTIPGTILGMVDIVTDPNLSDTIPSIVAGKVVTSGTSLGASFRNLTGTTGNASIEIAGLNSAAARVAHLRTDSTGNFAISTGSTTFGTYGTTRLQIEQGGKVTIQQGGTTLLAGVTATRFTDWNAVGNVGTGEDDLESHSTPSSTLNQNGDNLLLDTHGTFAANANNKRIRLYFGGQVLFDTTALAFNGGNWRIFARIYRTSTTSIKAIVTWTSSNATLAQTQTLYSAAGFNLLGANIIKTTGEATADNDIVSDAFVLTWHPTS